MYSARAKKSPTPRAYTSRRPLSREPNGHQAPSPQARYSEETRSHAEDTTQAEANARMPISPQGVKALCTPIPEEGEAPDHDED